MWPIDGGKGINSNIRGTKEVSSGYRPLVDFMVVGAQKCGTTALFEYLKQHPEICMSSKKEVHLFDGPDYSNTWTPAQIDSRYRSEFQDDSLDSAIHSEHLPAERAIDSCTRDQSLVEAGDNPPRTKIFRGEATPIYLFLSEIAGELKRYNPSLKLIVLLRDPAERAISHYYMEKNKGYERFPLWLALLCEPWRLWRCKNRRRHDSAWHRHSYRKRGQYRSQLRNLYRHFDEMQVLVIRTEDLAQRHDSVLNAVFKFLGVSERWPIEHNRVFEGDWGGHRHAVVYWLLRLSYLPETAWMKSIDQQIRIASG